MTEIQTSALCVAKAILGANDFIDIPDGQGGIERVGAHDLAAIVATELAPLFQDLADARWALLQSHFAGVHILGMDDKARVAQEKQWQREQRYDTIKAKARDAQ